MKALIAVGTLKSSPQNIVMPSSFPVSNVQGDAFHQFSSRNVSSVVHLLTLRVSSGKDRTPELQHAELLHSEGEAAADPLAHRGYPLLLQAAPQQQRRAGAQAEIKGGKPAFKD